MSLARGSISSIAVKVFGLIAALGAEVLLTRNLGPSAYGVYAFVFQTLAILSVAAKFGQDAVCLRFVAAYRSSGRFSELKGILRFSGTLAAALGCLIGAGLWLVFQRYSFVFDAEVREGLAVGALAMPLIPLLAVRESALQGLKYPALGQISSRIIYPLALITFLTASLAITSQLDSGHAILCAVAANVVAIVSVITLLARSVPGEVNKAVTVLRPKEWIIVGVGMLLVSGQYILMNRVDILMLEPMAGKEATGIYAVCVRLAWLVSFFIQAASVIAAPLISELYSSGQASKLQRIVHLTIVISSACSAVIFLALVLFGELVLGVFGPAFPRGYQVLVILAGAQLFNALTGPSGFLLTMTGHERLLGLLMFTALVLNCTLNFIMIPAYGMAGAACATGITTVLWNTVSVIMIRKKVGIYPVLGLSHLPPRQLNGEG